MRNYTVREIDDLRKVVTEIWLWGDLKITEGNRLARSHTAIEKATAVEERVRTYMTAGITADDLRKEYS